MKIGSLCTGYGGLDMAVAAVTGAQVAWHSEVDKNAIKILEYHWPDVPNLGDLKQIKWEDVEFVEYLTAGYPCQPFSQAGARKGVEDERHLWPFIKEGISYLRPNHVILENVRGHITLGGREVVEGLDELGYVVRWNLVRASDVGAPHQRARLFIVATNPEHLRQSGRSSAGEVGSH